MGDPSYIETFYARHVEMHTFLLSKGEVSYASDLSTTFGRSLVLAIASYFEHEITTLLKQIPERYALGNQIITSMIERNVVAYKYHTYFDWKRLNAGPFISLFGEDIKKSLKSKLAASPEDSAALASFLEVGRIRNNLVHQNYVQFDVAKTPEELYTEFKKAVRFIDLLNEIILPVG